MNNDPSIIKDDKKKIASYLSVFKYNKKKIASCPSMFKDEKKKIASHMDSKKIIHINGEYGIGKTRLIKDVISEKNKNIKGKNIKGKNIKGKNIILIENMVEFDGNDIPWYKLRKNKSLPKLINACIWSNSLKNIILISLGFITPFISILWNIQAIDIIIKIIFTIIFAITLIVFLNYKYLYATLGIFSRKKPKNIFIENIDRLPWDDAYKLLREAYLLKESKKNITFFFSYSQQKLKSKFLLKYGKGFKDFTIIDEIEKYIDDIINLDASVKKNVRYEIIDSIFKEELKNIENHMDKLDMMNKIKIETKNLYEKLNINNFRILKKSIKETIACNEIISVLQLNETIIFKLKMLLHLDIGTYLNLEKDINEIQKEYNETKQLSGNRSTPSKKKKYWRWTYTNNDEWPYTNNDVKKEEVQNAYIGHQLLIKEIIDDIIDHGNSNWSAFETHDKMDYSWKVYFLGKNYQNIMKLFNKKKYHEIYLKNDVDMVYRTLAFQKIKEKEYDFAILFKMITDMTENDEFRLREINKIVNFEWDNLNELELYVLIHIYEKLISRVDFSNHKELSNFYQKIINDKIKEVVQCLLKNKDFFSKKSSDLNDIIIVVIDKILKSLMTKIENFARDSWNVDQIINNITIVDKALKSNKPNSFSFLTRKYLELIDLKRKDIIKIFEHFQLFTIDIWLAGSLKLNDLLSLANQKDENGISKYKLSYSRFGISILINKENQKDVIEMYNDHKNGNIKKLMSN